MQKKASIYFECILMDWTRGSSKRRRCSTHGTSPDWTRGLSLREGVVLYWTCGSSTHGRCSTYGLSPRRSLKTGRCSEWDWNILFRFLTQCYYPHMPRESVSPLSGIILIWVGGTYWTLFFWTADYLLNKWNIELLII